VEAFIIRSLTFPVWPLGLRLNARQRIALRVGEPLNWSLDDAVDFAEMLTGVNDTAAALATIETLSKGFLTGKRSVEIIVSHTVALLDFVLKGKKDGILQGPSRKFPEVTFL
jgi:hypothetical protein